MKKLLFLIFMGLVLTGCGKYQAMTPYGQIVTDSDSKIVMFTDADVKVQNGVITSNDTTLFIISVSDTDKNLKDIFNHAMTKIEEIFGTRGEIYEGWIK